MTIQMYSVGTQATTTDQSLLLAIPTLTVSSEKGRKTTFALHSPKISLGRARVVLVKHGICQ